MSRRTLALWCPGAPGNPRSYRGSAVFARTGSLSEMHVERDQRAKDEKGGMHGQ